MLKSARDLAKLTQQQWVDLITANGSQVPPSTDGQTPADKVQTYASTLINQSERMFPAIALAAMVARSPRNPLPNIGTVQKFLDDNPDFNLRADNVDAYVKDSGVALDDATLTQTRVMQRVHRIAPRAAVGQVLLDNRIHNSSQIVAMGKERFARLLTGGSQVDRRTALTVFGMAEFQYAQVLQRMASIASICIAQTLKQSSISRTHRKSCPLPLRACQILRRCSARWTTVRAWNASPCMVRRHTSRTC